EAAGARTLNPLPELLGILLDPGPRVVMHRDDDPGLDELHGPGRLGDAHGETVADGQARHVDAALQLREQLHIAEDTRVPRKVNAQTAQADHVPDGNTYLPPVAGEPGRVDSGNHFDRSPDRRKPQV